MIEPSSFKIVSRRRVFQNSRFDVFSDHLECPDGTVVKDYLSVFPLVSSTEGITGVAVLPVIDRRMGLLSVNRHPMGLTGWEIPRGFVDRGESPREAAVRELREETGLETTLSSMILSEPFLRTQDSSRDKSVSLPWNRAMKAAAREKSMNSGTGVFIISPFRRLSISSIRKR